MNKSAEEPEGEIQALRRRLSRLSEASLRINVSPDFAREFPGIREQPVY